MDASTSLRIHKDALEIAAEISALVAAWSFFHQQTMGIQIVRSADSIPNNIAEGYGRSGTGERIQFMLYADASLYELRNQIRMSHERNIIATEQATELDGRLLQLSISTIEFCRSLLERDPTYTGPFRDRIYRRMWWRKKSHEDPHGDPHGDPHEDSRSG